MPHDLPELFARDPLQQKHTDEEVEAMVADYRGMRARYQLGDVKAGSPRKATPPKALAGADAATMKDILDIEVNL